MMKAMDRVRDALGSIKGTKDADGPHSVKYKGKEYWKTGKTGKRISNGEKVEEYEEVGAGAGRVWREVKSGVVYPE